MPEPIDVVEDAIKSLMASVMDQDQWDVMPVIMLVMGPPDEGGKNQLVYVDVPPDLWNNRHPADVMLHLAMLTALPSRGGLITDPGVSAKLLGLVLYSEGYGLDSDLIPEGERADILAQWEAGNYPIADSPYGREIRMFLGVSSDGHTTGTDHMRDTEYTATIRRDEGGGGLFDSMMILFAAFKNYYEGK